jgi:phenylalanyl-tRNA synthetase beta subunit
LVFRAHDRTLKHEDADSAVSTATEALRTKLSAEIRA